MSAESSHFFQKPIIFTLIVTIVGGFLLIPLFVYSVDTYYISKERQKQHDKVHSLYIKDPRANVQDPKGSDKLRPKKFRTDIPVVSSPVLTLPVIMYHHVASWEWIPEEDGIGRGLRVAPDVFEKQLQYLQAEGYTTVTTLDIYAFMSKQGTLPDKPILLTFDDGYTDNYTNAFPLLKKYNMKGDFAIITEVVGTSEYAGWDQLREMKEYGMSFSSHTTLHCVLAARNPDPEARKTAPYLDSPIDDSSGQKCESMNFAGKLSTGAVRGELELSKKALEDNLKTPVVSVVYPFGYYNDQTKEIAQETGFYLGFTVKPMVAEELDLQTPFDLPRYRANGQDSGTKLSGFFAGYR